MLVSSAVRTLDIWLKTGWAPCESDSLGCRHCGIVSLVGFSSMKIIGGDAWGESWERFTCVVTQGMQMVGIAGTLRESISSLSSKKSFCLHGNGPLIFPPEVMVEIYSSWAMRTGKLYCWRRSRKAS